MVNVVGRVDGLSYAKLLLGLTIAADFTIAIVKQQSQYWDHYRDTIVIVLDALGVVVGAVK